MYQSITQSRHQSIDVPMYQSINQSMYQCINVSMYQCTNVSINQSIEGLLMRICSIRWNSYLWISWVLPNKLHKQLTREHVLFALNQGFGRFNLKWQWWDSRFLQEDPCTTFTKNKKSIRKMISKRKPYLIVGLWCVLIASGLGGTGVTVGLPMHGGRHLSVLIPQTQASFDKLLGGLQNDFS